ncbi:hypothetical protein [Labrys wisconsinensis]|uniref:Uncharacterized protein n=1 Tax=Labrys wisconsinensis TaxID=425677 RepID=A0ABU0JCK8_9HYPH|nr:hypothetical protein [Labrys wisconsinensis]MDQ0471330.1 hypothetical protein [Labrys wisconsinensis]
MARTVLRLLRELLVFVVTGAMPRPRWAGGDTLFARACAAAIGAGVFGWACYNDYTMLRFGQLWAGDWFQAGGWISSAEAPAAYAVLSVLYATISLAPAVWIHAHFRRKCRNRQAAIRQVVEGGGPAPIVRRKQDG